MSSTLLDNVIQLLNLNIGDTGRLEHIKSSLEENKTLYQSDAEYLKKLTEQYLKEETEKPVDDSLQSYSQQEDIPSNPPVDYTPTFPSKDQSSHYPKFHSLKTISKLTLTVLILSISITIINDISSIMEINLLSSIDAGNIIYDAEMVAKIDANDLRVGALAVLATVIGFASLIIFYIWFYKAYRNLPSLGAKELSYSARWVVLRFFIPILCVYQPYRATKEIWKSSDPTICESDKQSRNKMKTPLLIKFWWAFWIIGGIIGMFYLRSFSAMMNTDTIGGYIALNYMDMITDVPMIILDILTFVLVRKISLNQEKKSQSLNV